MKVLLSILKSRRLWGIVGTAVGLYFLVFVVLGKLNMSWIMPDTNLLARRLTENWQNLPFFAVRTEPVRDDKGVEQGQVVYYTVPTHQFTAREMAQMGMTNATAHPAAPK